MRRENLRLSALALALALIFSSSCVTVEFRDPEAEPEPELAEADPGLLGSDPDFESPIGFGDPSAAAEDEFFGLEDPFADEAWSLTESPTPIEPQPTPDEPEEPEFRVANWDRNPSRAIRKADALNRPMVLLFTALEWNENAHKLSNEVFLTKTFNEFANQHLILSFLDYPRKPLDTPDIMRRIKEKYRINGFPTLLLLDSEGNEVFRKKGYRPGRARDYFNELRLETLKFRGVEITVEAEPAAAEEP